MGLTLGLLALVAVMPLPAEDPPGLEFELFNGEYSEPDPALEPVHQGPITVQLRSPSNSLRLHRHQVWLSPVGDGTYQARFWAEFEGRGDLEATLSIGKISTTLNDEVHLPRQELELEGTVRLEKAPGGYRVVAVALPESIQVTLESRIAGSLVKSCQGLTRFLPLVGCGGLEGALRQATIPLPPAGTELLLQDALLTREDHRQLERLLAR